MITYLTIQIFLAAGISVLFICYHFIVRILPGIGLSIYEVDIIRIVPYIVLILGIVFICILRNHRNNSYMEFIKNSPGKSIDTTGIEYGLGHGFKNKK